MNAGPAGVRTDTGAAKPHFEIEREVLQILSERLAQ